MTTGPRVRPHTSSGERHTLKGQKGGAAGLSFSPDGTRLAAGSLDTTVHVWKLSKDK